MKNDEILENVFVFSGNLIIPKLRFCNPGRVCMRIVGANFLLMNEALL